MRPQDCDCEEIIEMDSEKMIEKISDDGINDILGKIQDMLDPECKHDLGGEADFFTFQDGKGFTEFIEEFTNAMSFYYHATKMKINGGAQ